MKIVLKFTRRVTRAETALSVKNVEKFSNEEVMNEHIESHNGVTNEELLQEMKKTKEEVLNAQEESHGHKQI